MIGLISIVTALVVVHIASSLLVGGHPFPFLTGKKITLTDVWGDTYTSYKRKDGSAYVYPWTQVGHLRLLENGEVDHNTYRDMTCYIKSWKDYK